MTAKSNSDGRSIGFSDRADALPALRQDVEILPSGNHTSDTSGWLIYDGLRHRYFSIDHATSKLLTLWREGLTAEELSLLVSEQFGLEVDTGQISQLAEFLSSNNLTVDSSSGAWLKINQRAKTGRESVINRIVHNYLFFKVPLVRPQQTLQRILPRISFLFTSQFMSAIVALGLVGVYLVSRQWDSFVHTFQGYFTPEGLFLFGLSLILVKTAHELGHAFAAVRFGCRVPTMGVAFMVLVPVLYTDVSDAWRLRSRRQRLLIDGAGILVELGLACTATFLWAFIPDGPLRAVVFMVATTGWVLSLGINLNPFMRFDGYYLLSDLVGIDNLQPRAFALGRWKIRQIVFATAIDPPERLASRTCNGLILYAWMTWLYRLVVFTGIAILVYHYCFKALGIVLFLIEIWFFILRPIVSEVRVWQRLGAGNALRPKATLMAGATFAVALLVFLPLSTSITVPAVVGAADLTQVYPVRPAKVASVETARGDALFAGRIVATLFAPEIEKEIDETKINVDLIKVRLARSIVDEAEREQYAVLTQQLAGLQSKLSGLLKERDELVVRSPITGSVLELGPDLHVGRWLGKTDPIVLVASREKFVARGYVAEGDIGRINRFATGRFIPDDVSRPSFAVKLTGIARSGAAQIDILELASVHGGPIPVETDAKQRLVPVTAQYQVEFESIDQKTNSDQLVRGVVELNGAIEHLLMRALRNVWRVLVRESGF